MFPCHLSPPRSAKKPSDSTWCDVKRVRQHSLGWISTSLRKKGEKDRRSKSKFHRGFTLCLPLQVVQLMTDLFDIFPGMSTHILVRSRMSPVVGDVELCEIDEGGEHRVQDARQAIIRNVEPSQG